MEQQQFKEPSTRTLTTITTTFDPNAVPSFHPFNLQTSQQESEDLIDLGEESLFTGTRNGNQVKKLEKELLENVESTEGPVVSEELLNSLNVAKTAFMFALTGLLNQVFNLEPMISPLSVASTSTSTSTLSIPNQSNSSASTLLDSIRKHSQISSSSNKEPIQFYSTYSVSNTTSSLSTTLDPTEEIQIHLSSLVADRIWLGQDAELGMTLVSLLICIERLLKICGGRSKIMSEEMIQTDSEDSLLQSQSQSGENVYSKVEREALALRESNLNHVRRAKLDSGVVSAAREVELAEMEVLWGRVDDLSEKIGYLCAKRELEDPFEGEEESSGEELEEKSSRKDDALPEYASDLGHPYHPPSYDSEGVISKSSPISEKSPPGPSLHSPRTHNPPYSPIQAEKMQQDLNLVTSAIERLYLVSPQLANQRVEVQLPGTKILIREKQLAKLGNAIERLSKGRLEDQRAIPGFPVEKEGVMEKARRVKKAEELALERMLDQIDRAASRTLLDQRVDMSVRRKVKRHSFSDPSEQNRREFILSNTGKGRLASQDASFTLSSTEPSLVTSTTSNAVTISEFFKQEAYATSSTPPIISVPLTPSTSLTGSGETMRRKFSGMGLFAKGDEEEGSPPGRLRRISSTLGIGMFRTHSKTDSITSTPTSTSSTAINYIAEESRNLGTVTITFWPRSPSLVKEEWEIVSIQFDSLSIISSKTGIITRVPLPCQVIPQTSLITTQGTFYECKLSTVDHSTTTQARPDLVVHAPLSTSELRDALPTSYNCAVCSTELVDARSIEKYNALPSEHWAELLDSWMCHQDQTLSDDLISKGKGIKPRVGEGMVGSAYILFASELVKNWCTPVGGQPTRSEADDFLHPAHCSTCKNLIGYHVISLSSEPSPTYFRLLKYASTPISSPSILSADPSISVKRLRKYGLATHITAEMLEIGQAHACHRFAVEDAESEKVRLLLWLFNPAIRVSFSSTEAGSEILSEGEASILGEDFSKSMNAVKVFYTIVKDESDSECQDFLNSLHAATERIAYPLEVVNRLQALLIASTSLYPTSKRKWGDFEAGFLERV